MADAKLDANYRAREMLFSVLFRGRRNGIPACVQMMREAAAAGLKWSEIDCMFDPQRLNPEDRGVYQAVADALKAYARDAE